MSFFLLTNIYIFLDFNNWTKGSWTGFDLDYKKALKFNGLKIALKILFPIHFYAMKAFHEINASLCIN